MAAVKIQHKNCLQTTLRKIKINTLFAGQGRPVLEITVPLIRGHTQELWHSYSQNGPPGWQITYMYLHQCYPRVSETTSEK